MEQNNNNTQRKKWKQLSERDRYKIEIYLEQGLKASEIAKLIGCSKRTIERERRLGETEQQVYATVNIKERGDVQIKKKYLADVAQRKHEELAQNKGRNFKIGSDYELVKYIEQKIGKEHWSPEAVLGYIKQNKIEFEEEICVKTLYNYIDKDFFLGISNKNLLRKKNKRKRKYNRIRTVALKNRNGKSIEERPEKVNMREEFGHWEIDLVVGKQGTKPAILTLVERQTRKSMYILVKNKTQAEVIKAVRKASKRVNGDFRKVIKSITADNGTEFLDGEGIKKASKCNEIYYAHPYCSWERGSNENGNSILRRFIPKGTDIGKITKEELQRIEDWVNNYPRKIFGFKSANDMYINVA